MNWLKKGRIYCPSKDQTWRHQFAMLPTPFLVNDQRLRIFVGLCDREMVGRIGFVDVDPANPSNILCISNQPVLDVGESGCFDDNGVVPISVVRTEMGVFLYYVGFQLGVKVPYFMFCGLAISEDNGNTFRRFSKTPVLDRINSELYARCGCFVMFDSSENMFRSWYVGSRGAGWTQNKFGKRLPLYELKYITSRDGIDWSRGKSSTVLEPIGDEHGFGRPFVFKTDSTFKMLYSVRTYSRGYYIGYAESENGTDWSRMDDQAGITVSSCGWDNENISYPALFTFRDHTYMFYNGNGCGQTGFGYAELSR